MKTQIDKKTEKTFTVTANLKSGDYTVTMTIWRQYRDGLVGTLKEWESEGSFNMNSKKYRVKYSNGARMKLVDYPGQQIQGDFSEISKYIDKEDRKLSDAAAAEAEHEQTENMIHNL